MSSQAAHGVQLPQPPADGVTALRFAANADLLLVSSWDGTMRLYDAERQQLRATHAQPQAVLDCCFEDNSAAFSAGLEGTIQRHDFYSGGEQAVGSHGGTVRCLEWLPERRLLVSAGWDSQLKLWDPRLGGGHALVAVVPLPGKAYTAAVAGQRLVVGTSGRHVLIFDVRSLEGGRPEQARESSLKYQTRCIRAYPDGSGYALSSVEGRVAMEFFAEADQPRKYAFKCHRKAEGGKDVVFPVNAVAFHPRHGTFATGGCDGLVNVWDAANKKRLFQSPEPYPTSVAALAFSHDGALLAVAASYTFEQLLAVAGSYTFGQGDKQHPSDAVYVRRMAEAEVMPKQRR